MANTDFDPWDFEYEPEEDSTEIDEITDLDELYEFEDYDYGDLYEYEFHGTGDTGGASE